MSCVFARCHSIVKVRKDIQIQGARTLQGKNIPQGVQDFQYQRCHCPVSSLAARPSQSLFPVAASLLDSIIEAPSTNRIVIGLGDVLGLAGLLVVDAEAISCSVRRRVNCAKSGSGISEFKLNSRIYDDELTMQRYRKVVRVRIGDPVEAKLLTRVSQMQASDQSRGSDKPCRTCM